MKQLRRDHRPVSGHGLSSLILWIGQNSLSGWRERVLLRRSGYAVLYVDPLTKELAECDDDVTLSAETEEFLSDLDLPSMSLAIGAKLHADLAAVVIEDSVALLDHFVRVYPGTIIYRTLGCAGSLTQDLEARQVGELARRRDNLIYAPVAVSPTSGVGLATVVLPSLQVTDADLRGLRWSGAGASGGTILVVVSRSGDPDADRRQSAFVDEAFADLPAFKRIDLRHEPEQVPGLAALDAADLHHLSNASCLIEAGQSGTILHGFAMQAILLGIPIIYFADTLLAHVLAHGAGCVRTVSEARALASQLSTPDWRLAASILDGQHVAAERLRAAQAEEVVMATLASLIEPPRPIPAATGRTRTPVAAREWYQLERLLRALSVGTSPTEASQADRTRAISCLFHVVLERDASLAELARHIEQSNSGVSMFELMTLLFRTEEGRKLRPSNRMLAWLQKSSDVADPVW